MAENLFQPKEPQVFGVARNVIDGNAIVKENQARNAQAGSYGRIANRATGEVVEHMSNVIPENYTELPEQNSNNPHAYNEEIMMQDEGYRNYAQAYEYETGMQPSYEEYAQATEQPAQEELDPQELEDTIMSYATTMGDMSNYMEENGISLDDVINRLPEEVGNDVIEMVKDPRKMSSFDDMVEVGMAIDYFADSLNLDTEKFFGNGTVEECGEECQQKRVDNKTAQEQERLAVPSYEDRMAMLEQQ